MSRGKRFESALVGAILSGVVLGEVNSDASKDVLPMNGSSAFRPTLLAVDDEPEELVSLERELGKRYSADYRVVCEDSAEAGPLPAHDEVNLRVLCDCKPGLWGKEGHERPTGERQNLTGGY
jgi:hypothetical protein